MWKMIVCDGDTREREQILEYIRCFGEENNLGISAGGCDDWPELFEMLRKEAPDVVVIAQDGVKGLDTITSAHLSPKKIIWFSDLDFGVQAYRLCLSWFGKKPVTYPKMKQALVTCMKEMAMTGR